METIGLVACGAAKQTRQAPAELIYTSDLFQKSRQYITENTDRWFILSSKHGLLLPQTVIDPYEVTLKGMPEAKHNAWANYVLKSILANTRPGDRLIFLAGRDYRDRLIPELQKQGYQIEVPMKGLRIGSQMAWLNENTGKQPTQ